jgi:hypothetical protein
MSDSNSIQRARKKYEGNYLKITARIHLDFSEKIKELSRIHGSLKAAIENSVDYAYTRSKLTTEGMEVWEREKQDLLDAINQLKGELAIARQHQIFQDESDRLINELLDNQEASKHSDTAIDKVFLDVASDSDRI